MKLSQGLAMALVPIALWTPTHELRSAQGGIARTPVMVELFTSEGCSSCPPADKFLEKLDRQPIPGVEIIVLGEHVDYWDHIGWKDPYSSNVHSQRQGNYARRFGLDGVYTPQMVVDGATEFVGSDSAFANRAFSRALKLPKVPVRISSASVRSAGTLRARVEAEALSPPFQQREAEVYLAVALSRAESRVSGGENSGRTLAHVAVVLNLLKIGAVTHGGGFAKDVRLTLGPGPEAHNLRVIAFLQEPKQGRILGAAEELILQ